jgi:hypothetical protein
MWKSGTRFSANLFVYPLSRLNLAPEPQKSPTTLIFVYFPVQHFREK